MRIKTRFIFHLALGLVFWILVSGVLILFVVKAILPLLHILLNEDMEGVLVGWIFAISTILCIGLFGWYFGSPIGLIMMWIHQLSQENYKEPKGLEKMYTRKGKLRMRFLLYKEVLQHLESLAVKLQAAEVERNKIEKAKQEWIAGISHDLKTPLTYISGYSTLLLNEGYVWAKEEALSFIQEIHDKGKHMEGLIQDLGLVIQFNNADGKLPISKSRQDLVEFTRRAVADISNNPQASSYNLHFHSDTPAVQMEFDPRLMQRMLQNILMNSIMHNPEQTEIYTCVSDLGDHAAIYIKDNGVGMPPDVTEHLFQQYYRGTTTDSSSDGTGLGMAIVSRLIEAHNGTITVESETNKGTAFHIRLPKL